MNNPKRQHYIPEMLLKHFCDENGYLRVGDTQERKIWKSRPDGAFVITNLYTKVSVGTEAGNSANKSYEYEEALGKIESKAAPIIESIIAQVRRKKIPMLSLEDETAFKRFIFSMARRTPESQRRLASTKDFEDAFCEVAKEHAVAQGYPLPDKETLLEDIRIVRLIKHAQHNVDARFAAGDHNQMHIEEKKFCAETGLAFLLIDIPKRSFVIGSHGIAIHRHKHGEAQGYLPISHDVCVFATPFPDKTTLYLLNNNGDRLIRIINRSSATQGQQIAGCSETLIRSLMRLRD